MSKKEQHLDRRVRRTRTLLRDALRDLVVDNEFDSLTIGEITDRAGLNRATFYLHYSDKTELLDDVFENMLGGLLPPPPTRREEITMLPREIIMVVLEHIAQYPGFYRSMVGKSGVPSFMARIQQYIEEVALGWMVALSGRDTGHPVDLDLAVQFVGSAFVGVIAWWLENDMPYPIENLTEQLILLAVGGTSRALGLNVIRIDDENDLTRGR